MKPGGGFGDVGLTTTIPVEVLFAAGLVPVDLNNLFVSHPERRRLLEVAVSEGIPQNTCAWLKGIFGAVLDAGGPERVVGVVRGDCSGTEVLLEALEARGIEVIHFSYPYPPNYENLERHIDGLIKRFGTERAEAEGWRKRLSGPRERLKEADRLCWESNVVRGAENHEWLVSSSDFFGDPGNFDRELAAFIDKAGRREPLDRADTGGFPREVRLGYIGVPPIDADIFGLVETMGARFVFCEVQRQFALPAGGETLEELYLRYTYPYTVAGRVADINREAELRRIDGIVHYVQSFCHRNLEDVIFNSSLSRPMLTLECDCPGVPAATTVSRLENFIQVLGENIQERS
jgi:benzoyl-CoA reductase/2-hydroxyglutaryl-CoA dehydratase subunit BcrC/BadD/HgdB